MNKTNFKANIPAVFKTIDYRKEKNLNRISLFFLLFLVACQEEKNEASKALLGEEGLFKEVLALIDEHYVEKPDTSKIINGALNGALSALDENSAYFSEDDYKVFLEITKGKFGGIGAEIRGFKNGLEVVPLEDGPAFKAGLKPGDIIVKVNDKKVSSLTPIQLLQNLHGESGTIVKLTILRDKIEKVLSITREIITASPVKYELDDKIAYIRIASFNEQTKNGIEDAISNIYAQAKSKLGSIRLLQGVIIDLRNNPGGTLDQALGVTSLFLDKGTIVIVKRKESGSDQAFQSTGPDRFLNIPIVILINKGSASASEVMAAALHDHKRAILLGEKTYGKGSVQNVFELNGKGAVKITVAYFTSPNGHVINNNGIEPDIVVETPIDVKKNFDPQKQRAVDLLQDLFIFKEKRI